METVKFIDGDKIEYCMSCNPREYALIQYALDVCLDCDLDEQKRNEIEKIFKTKPFELDEKKFTEKMIDTIGNVLMRTAKVDETSIEEIFKHDNNN